MTNDSGQRNLTAGGSFLAAGNSGGLLILIIPTACALVLNCCQ